MSYRILNFIIKKLFYLTDKNLVDFRSRYQIFFHTFRIPRLLLSSPWSTSRGLYSTPKSQHWRLRHLDQLHIPSKKSKNDIFEAFTEWPSNLSRFSFESSPNPDLGLKFQQDFKSAQDLFKIILWSTGTLKLNENRSKWAQYLLITGFGFVWKLI